MKTLQECKDEVARKNCTTSGKQYKNWDLMEKHLLVTDGVELLINRLNEAAELYARAKWDQACEAQLRHLGLDHMISQPKPEFKP